MRHITCSDRGVVTLVFRRLVYPTWRDCLFCMRSSAGCGLQHRREDTQTRRCVRGITPNNNGGRRWLPRPKHPKVPIKIWTSK